MKTLPLTPWMTPHKVIGWQNAITLIFLKKIEVLEEYEEEISSPSFSMRMPAVARLLSSKGTVKRSVKFSRVNVFSRDGFRCQYCGDKKSMRELNYDHVIPRTMGGKTVWENIVTSCYSCNSRKRNRTPEQAGMRLLRHPIKPKALPLSFVQIDQRRMPEIWAGYCSTDQAAEAEPGGSLLLFH